MCLVWASMVIPPTIGRFSIWEKIFEVIDKSLMFNYSVYLMSCTTSASMALVRVYLLRSGVDSWFTIWKQISEVFDNSIVCLLWSTASASMVIPPTIGGFGIWEKILPSNPASGPTSIPHKSHTCLTVIKPSSSSFGKVAKHINFEIFILSAQKMRSSCYYACTPAIQHS